MTSLVFLEKTAIPFLNHINDLVFVMGTCEESMEYL
jgi:hypothetical protein